MTACKSSNFKLWNLGGILTILAMAMCCGPVHLQQWMPCKRAWFRHGCLGQRMLSEHERYYGFGMDALVSVCSRNTNFILVLAWMLWSAYALGTRTLFWFWHGCFGQRMLSEHERYYGFGMDALVSVCSRNTNVILVLAWMVWSTYALGT